MKILLINHYAGSPGHGMEYRPYYMAREWVKAGHEVTIIAASYSHVRIAQPSFSGSSSEEVIDGIRYIWLKTPAYSGNGLKRVVNMISFVSRMYYSASRIKKELLPDAVIASSTYPLDIVPARHISKMTGARLIFEVHDLWPLSPVILGKMSPRHPFIMVMQKAENLAYRWADRVVSLLPLAKGHMVEHGMAPEKFVYVPNGILAEEWEDVPQTLSGEHDKAIKSLKGDGKFLVCYAGAHGLANSLESFIDSAEMMDDPRIHLVLVGDGPSKKSLMELASRKKLNNITFLPAVPKTSIPEILSRMDALFISLQKCELFRYGISPNKLLDYMMAGKPVINAVEAGNDPVRDAGCGVSIGSEDPRAIADAVGELVRTPEEERKVMGRNGRIYVREHHDYRKLAESFLEVLKK